MKLKLPLKSKTVDFSCYDSKNICMLIYDLKHKASFVIMQKFSHVNTSSCSVAHLFYSFGSETVAKTLSGCKYDNVPFYRIHDRFVIKRRIRISYSKTMLHQM